MTRLGDLAELVEGVLHGDAEIEITKAASITRASDRDITFVTSEKHLQDFLDSRSAAAIVSDSLPEVAKPTIRVPNPVEAFTKIVLSFRPAISRTRIGISPQAIVSPTARISDDVDIYPGAVIGDEVEIGCGTVIHANVTIMEQSKIGTGVTIFPSVVLYEQTEVGDRCILHAGVVLGAYGFGYNSESGEHRLSAQLGNVVIENDVEIGANTTIDRGTFESTLIRQGTKIDNLVMIGHNCRIGQHNLFCSQVGMAGSSSSGDHVVMAGQVGIGDHLHIGSKTILHAKSGVMHDIPEGQSFLGIPATPVRQQMQFHAIKAKLPEMRKELKRLARRIAELEKQDQSSSSQHGEAA